MSELEPIINLVEKKGISLTSTMDADEKNDLRAYLSLTEKIFTNAEVGHHYFLIIIIIKYYYFLCRSQHMFFNSPSFCFERF